MVLNSQTHGQDGIVPYMNANSMQDLLRGPATMSVPEGGRYLGLGRSASYDAAKRGLLPTIKVGERRLVVPAARLASLLGVDLDQGGDARAAPAA
jgi:hypothetical protein